MSIFFFLICCIRHPIHDILLPQYSYRTLYTNPLSLLTLWRFILLPPAFPVRIHTPEARAMTLQSLTHPPFFSRVPCAQHCARYGGARTGKIRAGHWSRAWLPRPLAKSSPPPALYGPWTPVHLSGSVLSTTAFLLRRQSTRPLGPQSLKYLPPGPLQKKKYRRSLV